VSGLFDWAQRLLNGWRVKPLRAGNGVAGYATSANTVDPHSIVVGRVRAQCGNVRVVRELACATDNALLLRDISEFDVAKLDTIRAATERTIALLKERRAALIAVAVTGQLNVMGSAA
jgi:hypothetical protein